MKSFVEDVVFAKIRFRCPLFPPGTDGFFIPFFILSSFLQESAFKVG
jgi:hypothetical protein